jgi:hypothetical protein
MVPLTPKETLLLYISAFTQVFSAVLVAKRPNEGHPYPITSHKLRYYFQSHKIKVVSSFPLGEILHSCDNMGHIVKWSVELGKFELQFYPRHAIKSQILADFVSEWTET